MNTHNPVTYSTEHKRLAPVLALARKLDIATNPAPNALFEAGSGGFQIWATDTDHPADWTSVVLDGLSKGAFTKPCAYVASIYWGWEGQAITHLCLTTDSYDTLRTVPYPGRMAIDNYKHIHNRPADITWAKHKIGMLFRLAGVSLPEIKVIDEP